MSMLIDSTLSTSSTIVDFSKFGETTIAVLPGGSREFTVTSLLFEVIKPSTSACDYPQFEIKTESGLSVLYSGAVYLDAHTQGFIAEHDLNWLLNEHLKLYVTVPACAEMQVRVTVIRHFPKKENDMGTLYTSNTDHIQDQFSKVFAHLDEIKVPQTDPKMMAEFGKLNTRLDTLENSVEEIKTPPVETEKKMSETDKRLDNSLWEKLPDGIREAAEKAGIGLEDLHEMTKEYIALKENSRLYRRLLNFVRDDNHQTQLPISLAKIEAEKEMKLAKIEADKEIAKAEALSETAIAQAEADKAVHVAQHLATGLRGLISWSAAAATLSYIAYCVCGVFI